MFQIHSKSKFVKISVSEDSINYLQTALNQSKYVVFRRTCRTCKRLESNRVPIFVMKRVVQGIFHQRDINHGDANEM